LFKEMKHRLNESNNIMASEFAMGLLEGDALARAKARMKSDREFALLVQDWQEKLSPMLDEIAPVRPGRQVWEKISTRTFGPQNRPAAPRQSGLWGNLSFWRGLSFVSAGFATAAVAGLIFVLNPAKTPKMVNNQPLVAGLTATGKEPAFLARFDPVTGGLIIRTGLRDEKETRVAELWLIPADGVPRSLGLLDEKGVIALDVTGKNRVLFAKGGTLAVSLEPAGGSPTGAPTGPVIASGKLQTL